MSQLRERWLGWVARRFPVAALPAVEAARLVTAVGIGAAACVAALGWALGFASLGVWSAVWLLAGLVAAVLTSLALLARGARFDGAVNLGLAGAWGAMTMMQAVLGGAERSGSVGVWVMVCPLVSSLLLSRRATLAWLAAFVASQVALHLADGWCAARAPLLPEGFAAWNRLLNFGLIAALVVLAILGLGARLDRARERIAELLHNALPRAIAERLQRAPGLIADAHPEVTVLFADLVGFTPLAARLEAAELVRLLDRVFSTLDALAERHGLAKIKTIGDAYLAVGGLTDPAREHAADAADFALALRETVRALGAELGVALQVRVGLHTGPVVAGVIGRSRYSYDVWGDTVNTASRMESSGEAGAIQLSEATRARLGARFRVVPRTPPVVVRGKGEMATYWLEGHASAPGSARA